MFCYGKILDTTDVLKMLAVLTGHKIQYKLHFIWYKGRRILCVL